MHGKNIILLNTDSFRHDNIWSLAGTPFPVRTPNLEAFARERAAAVDRFYTGSFPTIPERTDMVTARYGWPWYGWRALPSPGADNQLTSYLRSKGYGTQLICDCPHLFPARFNDAFHGALHLRGQEGDTYFTRFNRAPGRAMPWDKTRRHSPDPDIPTLVDLHRWQNQDWRGERDTFPPRTAETVVEWLEENHRGEPFFLWVDFFDPHEPWDPPEYMVERYQAHYSGQAMLHPNYGPSAEYTTDELVNLRAHYAAEAELVDRWLGRVLQKIDDLRLWDDTVVLVTSDHGISIGEHERCGKSNIHPDDQRYWPLYPEIAHVPFLIAAPGVPAGVRCEVTGQPVDTMPTLLDLAGVAQVPANEWHGRSLAPVLTGETDAGPRPFAVTASFLGPGEGVPAKSCTPGVYKGDWAYFPVGAAGDPELYRLDTDPLAGDNVIGANADKAGELQQDLEQWLVDHDAPEAVRKALAAG
jgi:arylsulfatase A-like enzyme